jgi:hypothetical protein
MLIVPLNEARSGMVLAAPVAHPDRPDQDLLKPGYVLADQVIERLRELHVPFIYVDYPALDCFDRHLEVYLTPARQALYGQIKNTMAATQILARPGVAAQAFKALAERRINIRAITTSEIKFSLLIDANYTELAVRTLHSLYELDK